MRLRLFLVSLVFCGGCGGTGDTPSGRAAASRMTMRPSKAILGHWKSVDHKPGMSATGVNAGDLELYVASCDRGIKLTEVWSNGTIKENEYKIEREDGNKKEVRLLLWYEKKSKYLDNPEWLRVVSDTEIVLFEAWNTTVYDFSPEVLAGSTKYDGGGGLRAIPRYTLKFVDEQQDY